MRDQVTWSNKWRVRKKTWDSESYTLLVIYLKKQVQNRGGTGLNGDSRQAAQVPAAWPRGPQTLMNKSQMLALCHAGRAQWTSAKWLAYSPWITSEGRIYSPHVTDEDYKAQSLVTCLRPLDQEGVGLDLNPEPVLLTALLHCPKSTRAVTGEPE